MPYLGLVVSWVLITLSLLWGLDAHAARPTCPATPNCTAPLPACNGVCSYDSGTNTWTCDLDDGPGTNGVAVAVADFFVTGSAYCSTWQDYAAWGTTRTGASFFCSANSTTSDPVEVVELYGTPGEDELCFEQGNWILAKTAASDGVSLLTGRMFGEDGGDEMEGSPEDASDYTEVLEGGGGNDDMYGQTGDDVLLGGDGADTMDGEGGDDSLNGGAGNDTASGGDGEDLVCGGADVDTLHGNDDPDILDGGGHALDTKYGGDPTFGTPADQCDATGSNYGCETGPATSSYTCP